MTDPLTIGLALGAAVLLSGSKAQQTAAKQGSTVTGAKHPFTAAQVQWLQRVLVEAGPVIEAAGLPVSVHLAQASVETDSGRAAPWAPWGIRGSGDAGSGEITTHEYLPDGTKVKQTGQKFAKWSSLAAAARGLDRFLKPSSPRYGQGRKWYAKTDPGRWLLWLWGRGYATGPNYASVVAGRSKLVAVALGRPDLVVPWTGDHGALAIQLSRKGAGKARLDETAALLTPAGQGNWT